MLQLKKLLFLAVLACMLVPSLGEAQAIRFGTGGGYRSGGWGPNPGYGYRGWGYGSPYYGGYGYGRGYYQPGFSINLGTGYPYRGGYYSTPGTYYSTPTYVQSAPAIATVPSTSTYQSFYAPSSTYATNDNSASVTVIVPENADVWWNGQYSSLRGTTRRYQTSPMGSEGSSQLFQARWVGPDGQQVTQSRRVQVTPNGNFVIDFTRPENSTGDSNTSS